jgi:multidrug efflux system membrane fusion protein
MAKGTLTVFVDGQDGKQLDQGKLNLIDNQIVQSTGTIRLRAEFPNKQHLLWPGELVNARLLLDTEPNALTVDSSAVQQGPHGAYVYIIDNNMTVRMQSVHVAQIDHGQALIDQGLAANEKVVVAGQYRLEPGAHVTELHGKAAREVQQSEVEQEVP